jgi:sialidase-1
MTSSQRRSIVSLCIGAYLGLTSCADFAYGLGESPRWVEGFDQVEFHHNANRSAASRDFRGMAPGYMTAGWWAPGQMKDNSVSWKTAVVPAKQATTFVFIASSSVLPSEFSRGPSARLTINGREALTFTLGCIRDFTWKEGEFQLKYISKRLEFPYFGSHRQLELNGNSGLYQLSVPADVVEAGQPAVLKVELLPFAGWNGGWFMVKERRDTLKQSMEILQGEIDALRQDMATITQQTHILATQLYGASLEKTEFVHEVIYNNGFRHLHPADLVALRNGELLIMTREASEHYAQDGDVSLLRSKDGGLTWGEKQRVAAIKDVDEREGCGVQLRDGTIVVGIFYNKLYNPDGSYIFNDKKHLSEPEKRYLGTYIITSEDNGRTWSEPHYLDVGDMPFRNVEGPTDAPIEMPDGSILMGLIGYNISGDEQNRSSVMLRSTDKGKTWTYLSTIATDPGGKLGGFVEPGLVRTKSGRIVVAMRNHGPDHAIYTTYSEDDGKTWVPVRKSAMHGHPVDLIQLTDGRIMASYGVRAPIHDRPGGIRACFSRDNGETWDIQSEVQLRKDFLNWDVGYPESVELPDGRVLTVYYYNLFGKYFLGGTYWKP